MTSRKIGIVVSSTRPTRIGPKVADWVAAQAPGRADVDIIDLAEVGLPFIADPDSPRLGNYVEPTTIAWAERISGYDGLVVALPEYNGSYPAVLKNAFDTLYAEWNDLPIGVVGYGWGAAADAAELLGRLLGRLQAVHLPGPGLKLGEHLTTEGEILDPAPADEVRALFDQVLAAADEQTEKTAVPA